MPGKPSNLIKFWQELKRRKVIHVIVVYSTAAFVLIELVNNVYEPLRLPDWTPTMIIVILAVGFPLAIIFSWIFDVTPEGIEKTKPAKEVKEEVPEKPSGMNAWKIATFVSIIIIVGLIIFHTVGARKQPEELKILDKSIAVLPFINDSPDNENVHIINGIMEAILDNLCKIEDLRVVSRTSVEQYRDNPKSIPEIGKEMNVSYILEGSGQKYGNNIRLTIQLLDARNDRHLWSSPYNREIVLEQIFDFQSEIAELVAGEIEAIITPEEHRLIESPMTESLTAYDFYQQGKEEEWKFNNDNENREALYRAEDLYHKALEYDSTFAQAYSGLAWVYWKKHYWDTYFSETFLDSVLILADIALGFNPQLPEAYYMKGVYFQSIGKPDQAIREFDRAIAYNPNDMLAYMGKSRAYYDEEPLLAIENLYKAVSLNRGSELPRLLRGLAALFSLAGFPEKAINYLTEALNLDDDSAAYYFGLPIVEISHGDHIKSLEYIRKAYTHDSLDNEILYQLAREYQDLGQYEESLKYFKTRIERLESLGLGPGDINHMHRIGYSYSKTGNDILADFYFKKQIEYCNGIINKGIRPDQLYAYYDRAAVFAYQGKEKKAIEDLRMFNQMEKIPVWMVTLIENDPLFNSIRDESEFQQIVQDVEAKYQAEHERVRKWLAEQGRL